MRGRRTKRHHSSRKKKKRIIITVSVIVGILLIICLGVYGQFRHYVRLMDYEPVGDDIVIADTIEPDDDLTDEPDSNQEEIDALEQEILANLEANATELVYNENVFNILLIGTDERSGETRGRSDTMILLSINTETQELVMTSFLRDIYLSIPGVGNNRLNAAYAYGGPALLRETLEQNFSISIDRYVQIGFDSFQNIIDEIGGVVLELSDAEIEYINKHVDENNQLTGSDNTFLLNGKQALIYARIRYLDSDFGRTERQRNVITALINQAKMLSVFEINSFLTTLLPEVTTDLTEGELFSIVLSSVSYLSYDLVSFRLPLDGTWNNLTINGMMVLGLDFATNREALLKAVYKGNH